MESIEVDIHNSIFRDSVAVCCDTWGHQVIVGKSYGVNIRSIFHLWEKGNMIRMGMPIKLAPNYVRVSVD